MADTEFKVDSQSDAVATMAEPWSMIGALLGGTAAMRKAGETFLPKWPKESDDSYKARVGTATLFPAFSRTCSIMAAKPFARPINIDPASVGAEVEKLLADVDMMGTKVRAFAGDVMLKVIQKGVSGVLVDMPPAQGERTKAEEQAAGRRPYMTEYPPGTVLGWKATRGPKGAVLTQLRLLEDYTVANGNWGETTSQQVRVLTPGAWQVWRKVTTNGQDVWSVFEEGKTTISVIPFVFFYGIRLGFGIGAPPLLDLAYMNVEHWQSSSDQQTILHTARVPILFAKGFSQGDNIVIGSSQATVSENSQADLTYVEHTGAAIDAGKDSITDLESRMLQAGAELLVQQPAVKTATQVTSEDEGNRSLLQKIVEDFEESLAACIQLMGLWLGQTIEPKVTLYKDFGSANLTEKSGDLLLRAADAGHISSETAFEQLQRMDVAPPDRDWETEKQRIANNPQPPAPAQSA